MSEGRVTRDVVDAGGVYLSRAAGAGGFVFMASPPVSESGKLASEVRVKAPYDLSSSAHARAQTRFLYERFRDLLEDYGASMEDVVQVEQYVPWKSYADGYIEVSRGPGFLEKDRPNSALMESGDLMPEGVVVAPAAVALVPGDGRRKELFSTNLPYPQSTARLGESYGKGAPFSEIVAAGPYLFTTLLAADYRPEVDPFEKVGIHPDASVGQWIWWGSEIRTELSYSIEGRLKPRMEVARSAIDQALHCTVYMTEIEDLYDLDLVWKETWPTNPPARTVVPVRGLGIPGREGAKNHDDCAVKVEAICTLMRPGFGAEREVIDTGAGSLGHESEGVKAGPLLWTSGQMAADENGPVGPRHISAQLGHCFGRLEAICEMAGTDLSNLLRLRAFVTDPQDGYAVYAALKERIPSDPPCVSVTSVPSLQVPEAEVILDAVAYVP